MSKNLKRIIITIFATFVRGLDLIVPKDNLLVLCAAPRYYGNSRYMFEHIAEQKSEVSRDLKVYWVSRDSSEIEFINSKYQKEVAVRLLTLRGIYKFLRSRHLFLSHGRSEYFYMIGNRNPRKNIINFWHGGPLKKMDGITQENKLRWNYMTSASEFETDCLINISKINFAEILLTGHPRYEYIHEIGNDKTQLNEIKKNYLKLFEIDPKMIILYAPTYRAHSETELFPFNDYNAESLIEFFEKNKIMCILRLHPNELTNLKKPKYQELLKSSNFFDGDINRFPSMQEMLLISDVLITDYSSSYYDYLIINRPTLFIPYDQNDYDERYGFSLDFDEMVRELRVETQVDLERKIEDIIEGKEYIKKKIEIAKKKYHQYDPLMVCETILNKIIKLK